MSRVRIEVVTLDAAGTLVDVARPVGETYAALARDHGGDLDPDALAAGFRTVFPEMPPMAFEDASAQAIPDLERDWWRTLVSRVTGAAGGVPRFDAFFDALFEHYARGSAWRTFADTRPALQALRARGIKLVVVSNFDSRLANVLRSLELDRLVDAVVYSSATGAAKPDPRIFAAALAHVRATPQAALHVGDHLEADYRGARDAGLAALLIDRAGRAPAGVETILSLEAITEHLD